MSNGHLLLSSNEDREMTKFFDLGELEELGMSKKIKERINELEERLSKTKVNKATQKSINFIRAQLAKLRDDLVRITTSKKGGGGGFGIKKSGDAQVAFIGFPSVGKSSLLNLLTGGNTDSKVAAYDFTTLNAIPGMMNIEGASIQLIDLPGIILGAAGGKGRGKEVLAVVRTADLILTMICVRPDGTINFDDLDTIRKEIHDAGIRLNARPPRIQVKEQMSGGVNLTSRGKQLMDEEEVEALMSGLNVRNAGVYFAEPMITPEQLIDHVMSNRIYTKELVVINKSDLIKEPISTSQLSEQIGHDRWILISAKEEENIDALRRKIFEELELIRVYLKPPRQEADMEEPIILHQGDTIEALCTKIHHRFVKDYRYALVWGKSAKHPGQKFKEMDHELADEDVVSIYLER